MAERTRSVGSMRTRVRHTAAIIRSLVDLARDRNLTYLAAAIAYYAFVSIIPLTLLALAIASLVGGETLAQSVADRFGDQLSSSGKDVLTSMLTDTNGQATASIVGAVTLSWSALKLFRGLDQAFDELYVDNVETTLLEQVKNALVVTLGISLAILLLVIVSLALSLLQLEIPFINAIGTVVLMGMLAVAFIPIYYVLPPVEVSLKEVLPGALVAGVGWVLLQFVFRLYAANASRYAAYGIIGAVLLFVTWLYFASIVILLGGAVNAVRRGDHPKSA